MDLLCIVESADVENIYNNFRTIFIFFHENVVALKRQPSVSPFLLRAIAWFQCGSANGSHGVMQSTRLKVVVLG